MVLFRAGRCGCKLVQYGDTQPAGVEAVPRGDSVRAQGSGCRFRFEGGEGSKQRFVRIVGGALGVVREDEVQALAAQFGAVSVALPLDVRGAQAVSAPPRDVRLRPLRA